MIVPHYMANEFKFSIVKENVLIVVQQILRTAWVTVFAYLRSGSISFSDNRNGVDRSGLFCVISAVIERLKIEQDVAITQIIEQMRCCRDQIIPSCVSRNRCELGYHNI